MLNYIFALTRLGFKSNLQNGLKGILIPSVAMLLNNLLFFIIWLGFFYRFPDIGGWGLKHMAVMYALGVISFGIVVVFADGLFELPDKIGQGGLDPALVQPKPVILSLILGRCSVSGFGEILTGIVLLISGWSVVGSLWPYLILFLICAILVWVAMGIALGTLTLVISNFEEGARSIFYSIIIFATKPGIVYKTGLKYVVYTIIPVAYMTYLPIEFFIAPDWETVFIIVAGAVSALLISILLFNRAVRNYTSQSRVAFGTN